MPSSKPKLIKIDDDTFKCGHGCGTDFIIRHSLELECASCSTVYGNLTPIFEDVVEMPEEVVSEGDYLREAMERDLAAHRERMDQCNDEGQSIEEDPAHDAADDLSPANEWELSEKEWADLNMCRSCENSDDPRLISVSHDSTAIVNPYVSVCGRFEVDPVDAYGDSYVEWQRLYNEAKAKNAG